MRATSSLEVGAGPQSAASAEPELRLLLEDRRLLEQPPRAGAVIGSLLVHLLILLSLPVVFGTGARTGPDAGELGQAWRGATPLIAPPVTLTQKSPGKGQVSPEVTLEGLLNRPLQAPPPLSSRTMPAAPSPSRVEQPLLPEPPKPEEGPRDLAQLGAPNLPPALGSAASPIQEPPRIQTAEKPKLAFESPGSAAGRASGAQPGASPVPMPPKTFSPSEAGRQMARTGGGGLIVGDLGEGVGGLGDAISGTPAPTRSGSSLELLSDPLGVDFRPYLIRILSTVKRNWLAVIPESARLGRRGKVQIQFAISRDGSVPKLVIALPSGAEALDRAAVAGISASNPFPPLPDEFRGQQVRLQFTFLYNIPAR